MYSGLGLWQKAMMESWLLECIDEKCNLGIFGKSHVNAGNAHAIWNELRTMQRPIKNLKLLGKVYKFDQDVASLDFKYSCMSDKLDEPRKEKNHQGRHRA
jgi:short subunit dehydrogenase-like uncharacterized protein